MGDAAEKWNKAERLAVAGIIAPHLRDQGEEASKRRVARVDKDGNVVGYSTLADVQRSLLLRRQIEFAVQPDTRPKEYMCKKCGRFAKMPKMGAVPTLCKKCSTGACADCGSDLSRAAAHRGCKRCVECAGKARTKPIPSCQDCGLQLSKKARYAQPGRKPTTRCMPCAQKARRKPLPTCALCGKQLSQSARVQPIKHCKPCSVIANKDRLKESAAKALAARWKKRSVPPISETHEP